MLERLLVELAQQIIDTRITFSVVVCDNDAARTAEQVVASLRERVAYKLIYCSEPRQNISLARNRAIRHAEGAFIAMIDDDELPAREWLIRMYEAVLTCQVDGALGPVRPMFPPNAPRWLIRSGLCDRPSYPTGTVLNSRHVFRTGNTLLRRGLCDGEKGLFREEYGLTGGEDGDFFARRLAEGSHFVWCNEAPVYEEVPPDRWLLSFHLKKAMRIGALTGIKMRRGTFPIAHSFITSAAVMVASVLIVPLSLVGGRHVFASYLYKSVYHTGRVFATLGLSLSVQR